MNGITIRETQHEPENYGYVETILRKFANIHNPEIIDAARREMANRRRQSAITVFSNEETGGKGTILATRDQNRVNILWHFPDRNIVNASLEFEKDYPADRVALLSNLQANVETFRQKGARDERDGGSPQIVRIYSHAATGFSLSPFSRRWVEHAKEQASNLWRDMQDVIQGEPDATPKRAQHAFIATTRRFEHRRIRAAMAKFVAGLDPQSVKIMRQSGIFDTRAYGWLNPEISRTTQNGRITDRHQAAIAFPMLFGLMVTNHSITHAIDRREPLTPAIAEYVNQGSRRDDTVRISPKTISCLAGIHWQRAGRLVVHHPHDVLRHIETTPKAWMPVSRRDWAAFHIAHEAINHFALITGQKYKEIVLQTGGNWGRIAKEQVDNPTASLGDFEHDLLSSILLPAVATRTDDLPTSAFHLSPKLTSRFFAAVIGDKKFGAVMQMNREWHQRHLAIHEEAGIRRCGNTAWPALTADQQEGVPGNIRIRALTNDSELSIEGARMNHCVGGYGEHCALHGSHIISLSSADGEPLSTAELVETGNPSTPIRIEQHFARGNTRPSMAAKRALDWYVKGINSGAIEVDYRKIEQSRQSNDTLVAMSPAEMLRQSVGFDPFDAGSRERAFNAFKPFLSRSERAMTLEQWLGDKAIFQDNSKTGGSLIRSSRREFSHIEFA